MTLSLRQAAAFVATAVLAANVAATPVGPLSATPAAAVSAPVPTPAVAAPTADSPLLEVTLGFSLWSPGLYGTLAVVIPAAAYPLLPSGPMLACELALYISGLVGLIGIQFFNGLLWLAGYGYATFPPWVLPLTGVSFAVADGRYCAQRADPLWTTEEFFRHAVVTYLVILYKITEYLGGVFLVAEPNISVHNGLVALALLAGNLVALQALASYKVLTCSVANVYLYVTSRHVTWWFWLKNTHDKPFNPLWSKFLWVMVVMSTSVSWFLWAVSVGLIEAG